MKNFEDQLEIYQIPTEKLYNIKANWHCLAKKFKDLTLIWGQKQMN